MNNVNQDDLLVAVMNKIAAILTGSDATTEPSPNSYIAWCRPGIPFQPEDLQFAVKGISSPNAEENRMLLRTAAEFSRVVNAVPTTNHIVDKTTYEQNGEMVWDIYNEILTLSKVPEHGLTPEEEQKIAKYRAMMVTKAEDLMGNKVTKDSDAMAVYKTKEGLYQTAAMIYNNKRLDAQNGDKARAVQDFALNGDIYRSQVRSALNDWVTNGYKNDFAQINAYIDQTTQKDRKVLKADLRDKFDSGKMRDLNSGTDFYISGFYPGNFVNNDNGWTKFTFATSETDSYSEDTTSSTSGGGSSWGFLSFGGGGSTSTSESFAKMNKDGFSMEFSITQVTIGRPWMSPEFITSSAWKWGDEGGTEMISDGKNPATGRMPSYPTTAIFVKDIKITATSMKSLYDEINKHTEGGASVGWGPFSVSASHSESSKKVTSHFDDATNTLTVNGMQLIAFKCFPMPMSPNPDPKITTWA